MKKNKNQQPQMQAVPQGTAPKKPFRESTLVQIIIMIEALLISVMFFLPIFKKPVAYNGDFFSFNNMFNFFPEGWKSYAMVGVDLFGKSDTRLFSVVVFALALVVPVLLFVMNFPKLRKAAYFGVVPIMLMVWSHTFFGLGFTVEQVFTQSVLDKGKFYGLQFAPLGYVYTVLILQLPILYIIFIIQSAIEASRIRKAAKNAPAQPEYQAPSYEQPMQEGYQQTSAFEQPAQNSYQQAPVFEQPIQTPYQQAPAFEQPAQNSFQQAPTFEQSTQDNSQPTSETSNNYEFSASGSAQNSYSQFAPDADVEEEATEETNDSHDEAVVEGEQNKAASQTDTSDKTDDAFNISNDEKSSEIESSDRSVDESEENNIATPVQMQPEVRAFCDQCGAKIEPGAAFCIQCGAPVRK